MLAQCVQLRLLRALCRPSLTQEEVFMDKPGPQKINRYGLDAERPLV